MSFSTHIQEKQEDKFELTAGVRQGGQESPMLYNLYMDFVMRIFLESCKNEGVQFLKLQYLIPESASSSTRCASGEVAIDCCGYADDLLIVFENKDDIKKGIDNNKNKGHDTELYGTITRNYYL